MSDTPSVDTRTSQEFTVPTKEVTEHTPAQDYVSLPGYEGVAETARALREGRLVTEMPFIITERVGKGPLVEIGDNREVPVEEDRLIDRRRVVEWRLPLEAIGRHSETGMTQFTMREQVASVQLGQEDVPTMQEVMQQAGADHIYKNYGVLKVHGWVAGNQTEATVHQDRLAQTGNLTSATEVRREDYFSKGDGLYPPDVRMLSLEPVGYSGEKDAAGNPYTPTSEMEYMDIDNYTLAIEQSVRWYAEQLERKKAETGEEQDGKLILECQSWGGRAGAQLARNREFVQEMHEKGLDLVFYLMEPAFRMQPALKTTKLAIEALRPLVAGMNEPKGVAGYAGKRMLETVRKSLTNLVMEKGAGPMKLEPTDPYMQNIDPSLAATLFPLVDLVSRPFTDEHIRQLVNNPLVGAVELAGQDTLVDNGMASDKLNKTYTIKDVGHVPQRIASVRQMEVEIALALAANNQYRDFEKIHHIEKVQHDLAREVGS